MKKRKQFFCEKKNPKNFCTFRVATGLDPVRLQTRKSFFASFFKKEGLPSLCPVPPASRIGADILAPDTRTYPHSTELLAQDANFSTPLGLQKTRRAPPDSATGPAHLAAARRKPRGRIRLRHRWHAGFMAEWRAAPSWPRRRRRISARHRHCALFFETTATLR